MKKKKLEKFLPISNQRYSEFHPGEGFVIIAQFWTIKMILVWTSILNFGGSSDFDYLRKKDCQKLTINKMKIILLFALIAILATSQAFKTKQRRISMEEPFDFQNTIEIMRSVSSQTSFSWFSWFTNIINLSSLFVKYE